MNGKIYNYIKTIVLLLLLLEAVFPHHHHAHAFCCMVGQCEEAPFSRNCQDDTHTGERVVICQGEKAICPSWVIILPLLLVAIVWTRAWNDDFIVKNTCHFGRWHLLYLPGKLYEFDLVIFRFLRPPPAVL